MPGTENAGRGPGRRIPSSWDGSGRKAASEISRLSDRGRRPGAESIAVMLSFENVRFPADGQEILLGLRQPGPAASGAQINDHVAAKLQAGSVEAESLPSQPFEAVSQNRISQFRADRQAQPRWFRRLGGGGVSDGAAKPKDDVAARYSAALREQPPEALAPAQAGVGPQALPFKRQSRYADLSGACA